MAIVKKYKVEIVTIVNHFNKIYTIEFSSEKNTFKYNPGQFLHLALDTDYDGSGQWPDSRCFSIQSNPDEKSIKITYSVKGQFTCRMQKELNRGTEVWLKLPYGDLFAKPHNKTNTVFIAGGTGITPFLSLFTHTSFAEYIDPRIYLGFRSKNHNTFLQELNTVESCNPKIYYEDLEGFIDISAIFSKNGFNSHYFISGPPKMIKSFKNYLANEGVPSSQILTDDWE